MPVSFGGIAAAAESAVGAAAAAVGEQAPHRERIEARRGLPPSTIAKEESAARVSLLAGLEREGPTVESAKARFGLVQAQKSKRGFGAKALEAIMGSIIPGFGAITTAAQMAQEDPGKGPAEFDATPAATPEPSPLRRRTKALPSNVPSLDTATTSEGLTRSQLRAGRLRSRFRF